MIILISRIAFILIFTLPTFVVEGAIVSRATLNHQTKPYKIIVNGKSLFIKANSIIKNIMVWTTTGNRIIEQRNINNASFTAIIPVNQKTFFVMIMLENGQVHTEKIGVQ